MRYSVCVSLSIFLSFASILPATVEAQCPPYLTQWGSLGSGNGQFRDPTGVATDADSNVYVVDSRNNRIQKFTGTGTFLLKWGSLGSGNGQFNLFNEDGQAGGVATDAAGNVYVADSFNSRIQKFTGTGTFLLKWGSLGSGDGQFDVPYAVATDDSGNVYVVDTGNARIQKFTDTGTYLLKWGSFGNGNGQFGAAVSAATDSTGDVYVGDINRRRIQKFTSMGTYLLQWGSHPLDPIGVATDAAGNIFVANQNMHYIQKFTGTGTLLCQLDGQFFAPWGVATDAAGGVYGADHSHRIQKFGPAVIPTGACCDPDDGSCEVTTEALCTVPRIFNGPGTDCDPNPCPAPNQPPVCDAGGPYSGNLGENIQFIGTGSSDPDGTIATYAWDFGDGAQGSGPTPTHAYTTPGVKTASLTVTDNLGAETSCQTSADINTPPVCDAGGPYSGNLGENIQFIGTGSSDPDGTITSYAWDFGDGTMGSTPTPTHQYTTCSPTNSYTVTLTVTDDDGTFQSCQVMVGINTRVQIARVVGPQGTQNVGEPVSFRAQLIGGTAQSYQWAIEGGIIKNFNECAIAKAGLQVLSMSPADFTQQTIDFYWFPLSSQRHPLSGAAAPRRVAVTVTMAGGVTCGSEIFVNVERNSTDPNRQPGDFYARHTYPGSSMEHPLNDHRALHGLTNRQFFLMHLTHVDRYRAWRTLFGYNPTIGTWDPATNYPNDPEINHSRVTYNASNRVPLPSWLTHTGTVPRVRPSSRPACDTQWGQRNICDFPRNLDLLACVTDAYWHRLVHSRVGPDMADVWRSPKDGLFWRFHEFVDLVRQNRLACPNAAPDAPVVNGEWPARFFPWLVEAPDSVHVVFSEAVTGVSASDLSVHGSQATSVTGSSEGPYAFTGFTPPPLGPVAVTLAAGGIQGPGGLPFAGDTWEYALLDSTLDLDGDGISNAVEARTHCGDPSLADTDEDGIDDGDEVAAGTNPLVDERWVDVTTESLAGPDSTVGVAWGDYDGDGDPDLFAANHGGPSRLYRNDSDSVFTDVTAGSLADPGTARGAAFGDYDNDGDLDLFVARGNGEADRLYRNDGGGTFANATAGPLGDTGDGHGVAWGDYDHDGLLDLLVVNDGSSNRLFRNLGGGGFADATPAGLSEPGPGRGAAWGDYDGDGDLDLVITQFGAKNKLFRNDGAGAFTDVTKGPLGGAGAWIGVAWGDYDNDGDLDLAIAAADSSGGNRLLRNDSGTFADATPGSFASGGLSASVTWADFDNDADLDLYATGQGDYPGNRLYRNDGNGAFTDVSRDPLDLAEIGWGAAAADYDRDGELDLYLGTEATNHLLRNDFGAGNHWLQVRLVGTISNAAAIGARVRVVAGGEAQIREISGGSGYCAQDEPIAAFGLGAATAADSLTIWWPNGFRSDTLAVAADQLLTIVENPGPVAIADPDAAAPPLSYALHVGRPMPFARTVTIGFDVPSAGQVTIAIYDAAGRLVRALLEVNPMDPGRHRVVWDGRNTAERLAPSGVYFCRFEAGTFSATRRLVMLH